jgi:hypothetical protein
MQIKLKDDLVFRNTVDGVYVEVGAEPVEVDEKTGKYLLEHFSSKLEKAFLIKSKEGK